MKKRSRLEIVSDILFSIQTEPHGAKSTHILYKANLSPQLLNKYLRVLTQDELIEKIEINKKYLYKVTKKGFEFLNKLKSIDEMCHIIEMDSQKRIK